MDNIIISLTLSEKIADDVISFMKKIAANHKKRYRLEKCKHTFEFSLIKTSGQTFQKMVHKTGTMYNKEYNFGKKLSENPFEGIVYLYDNGDMALLTLGSEVKAV